MANRAFAAAKQIAGYQTVRRVGHVKAVEGGMITLAGLRGHARIGDRVQLRRSNGSILSGEITQLTSDDVVMFPDDAPSGVCIGDRAILDASAGLLYPSEDWIGRIIDPFGMPLDGRPMLNGERGRKSVAPPPPAATRGLLGARLGTGLAVLNTFLPIVEGQRVGLFAGSGVGKSRLLAHLAEFMTADVVVIAMIGERGRELRHFVEQTLGAAGLRRAVIVAATSDQPALTRRRCAWTAMTIAEHFRDDGMKVLLLADSITRFAEAHREIAVSGGELPALRGFPASTAHMIMSLSERAGPGAIGQGAITAVFSVLVAGSDMEEPVADILRGVLDGHIVLDRKIAERGRYPAIDVMRSVSRSLPEAATEEENQILLETRKLLGKYEQVEMMLHAGLYTEGADPQADQAIRIWSDLDDFLTREAETDIASSFGRLALLMRRSRSTHLGQGQEVSRI